jgi:hypothetical protein
MLNHQPSQSGEARSGDAVRAIAAADWLAPMLAISIGIIVSAWQTLTSGFRLVQGDLGDTRLVNFTLEHSYRWLAGMPLAEDLWSPPISSRSATSLLHRPPARGCAAVLAVALAGGES